MLLKPDASQNQRKVRCDRSASPLPHLRRALATLFVVILTSLVFNMTQSPLPARAESRTDDREETRLVEEYGNLPLSFEVNRGQVEDGVRFLARGRNYRLALTDNGASMLVAVGVEGARDRRSRDSAAVPSASLRNRSGIERFDAGRRLLSVQLHMSFTAANPETSVTGLDRLPGKVNYYVGSDPDGWHTNIPTYARVKVRELYPGIDLVYYGNGRNLEYDLIVAPGANPEIIEFTVEGAERLTIDEEGNLVMHLDGGEASLRAPYIYQEQDNRKQEISGGYVRLGQERFGFEVTGYDASRPLIIDPVVEYATYVGGEEPHASRAVAVDEEGNAYVAGHGYFDYPRYFDAFVDKLNADGTARLFRTVLGGSSDGGDDYGLDMVLDGDGNIYLAGQTDSDDFPTTGGAYQTAYGGDGDGYVAKLEPDGNLIYATYLGGSRFDHALGIAADDEGNAYVSGSTSSLDFPYTLGGLPGAFVAKLNPSGSALVYANCLYCDERGYAIDVAVDGEGNAYVTGEVNERALFARLDADGAVAHASDSIAGSNSTGYGVAVADDGNAYVAGDVSRGPAWIKKFDPSGSEVYHRELDDAFGMDIAVDADGFAYVVGGTGEASDFPLADPIQDCGAGKTDLFVSVLSPDASALIFSTCLGGNDWDANAYYFGSVQGIALGPDEAIYVTGSTNSDDFPTTPNVVQSDFGEGNLQGYLVKIEPVGPCKGALAMLSRSSDDTDGDGLEDSVEESLGTDPENPDTDGDCLLDAWEAPRNVEGAGFDLDKDGVADVGRDEVFGPYGDLVSPPTPLHKDIFVEVDWQDCSEGNCPELPPAAIWAACGPLGLALCAPTVVANLLVQFDPMHHMPDLPDMKGTKQVIALFANAPVTNPDGDDGINLHVLVDENITHNPNCDQGVSVVRDEHFGTPSQRKDGQVMAAKALAFRYVWSGHSSFEDEEHHPGACETPTFVQIQLMGLGKLPLPAYDNTPFGDVHVGGRDILVTLSPLWICPEKKGPIVGGIEWGFIDLCFRSRLFPGMFPAQVEVDGQRKDFPLPINQLLCLPSDEARSQLWSRSLMHLLGHSLGLEEDDHVHNHVPTWAADCIPPDAYEVWDDLSYDPSRRGISTSHKENTPDHVYENLVTGDVDGDGIPAKIDNCPRVPNPSQFDLDLDGKGDACDYDIDSDAQPNVLPPMLPPNGERAQDQGDPRTALAQVEISLDPHPFDTDNDGVDNPDDDDDDGDGIEDEADNCPLSPNPNQTDNDGDGLGDACDPDSDNDGMPDIFEDIAGSDPLDAESQPEIIGHEQTCEDGIDNDGDGLSDEDDEGCVDSDGDTAPNFLDNCPTIANHGWLDQDGDGIGDACDENPTGEDEAETLFLPAVMKEAGDGR